MDADLLRTAATMAVDYAASVDDRAVVPAAAALESLAAFDEPLPEHGIAAMDTLRLLDATGSPATVASTGARYFGFVTGATYPVALASSWLLSAWDQNAALPVMSPVVARVHDVVAGWLVDLLQLPEDTGVAFVTGATVANAAGLAAGRDAVLAQLGWDAQADGLFGAPAFDVVVGAGRTRRCRSRSDWSGWAASVSSSSRRTSRAGCAPISSPISPGRCSCAPRRGR